MKIPFIFCNLFFNELADNLRKFHIIQRSISVFNSPDFINPCPCGDNDLRKRFEDFECYHFRDVLIPRKLITDI